VPQIAVVLGIREGTVKSRIHAAVQRMRDELERQDARP
jgi:DNA-directed RNA polymerase specialized sigma24 family protein